MAETLVKNQVCTSCGADVRTGAFFCYNCGSSVAPDIVSTERNGKNDEGEKTEKLLFSEKPLEEEKIPAVENKETPEKKEAEITPTAKPELKSAASMRRKPKTIQRKRIEIVWEEPASAPNVWFLLVAVLLTGFALGLWLLASYLE